MSSLRDFIGYLPSQENINCCTSSATLLAAEIIMAINGKALHFSRLFPYYMSRKMQNRLGEKGSELGVTLEAISKYGVCLDQHWPLRHTLVDKEPSLKAFEDASQYRINSFEHVSISKFIETIDNNIPIIIGMRTGSQFWKLVGPLSEQKYMPVNDLDNKYSYGHAVVIIGNMPDKNSWIIANSKGLRWGDRGLGILPYECAIDIGESYAIMDFAGYKPGKKISDN